MRHALNMNEGGSVMIEPIADTRADAHLLWIALSRWDNEGGASPLRPDSRANGQQKASTESGDRKEAPTQ